MSDRSPSKFTLGDVMIVVAAAAVALGIYRLVVDGPGRFAFPGASWGWWVAVHSSPVLAVTAPTLLALRLRPRRPTLRRALREPGTVACLTVVANQLIFELDVLLRMAASLLSPQPQFNDSLFGHLLGVALSGHAVMLLWLYLAASRRWPRAIHWADRAGRWYGAALILLSLVVRSGL